MGVSTCKSTPGTSDQLGLFIGVHIDFTEFRIAILSEEWKDVEEKKAITSDHPIEIPKSEVQEPLVDRIARKLKKNILRNEEFRGLRVKKIVISYNEADEVHDTLKVSFQAAIKKKGIRTIDRGQIECMRISTVYYDLIFTGGSPNERLANTGGMYTKAVQWNPLLRFEYVVPACRNKGGGGTGSQNSHRR
ncbi:hypothetical protein CAEBREN_25039 [Caenorhabditis brenneri]|uniref:Uncharacterized protein n=1 Tax=Caenorhabditis brenneri TaxID=135651 RepID=G0NIT0_CAEBE|nr:hypothetical protein CAEBREN_25039 [Caenorhabditis brenneri]